MLRALFLTLAAFAATVHAEPIPVGHRGLMHDAPENTLRAFAACLELGVGFELDVRRTRDGHLVILHDSDLKRTTDASGEIADLTLTDSKKLDAGRWFAPAFAGEKIPTLDEVFALIKMRGKPGALIAIDIKINDDKVEADIVRLAKKHGVLARLLCIGTTIESPAVRRRLRAADPATPTSALAQTAADLPKAIADKEATWVYARFVPSAEQVQQVHRAGKKIFVVGKIVAGREPTNWTKCREANVDAILTDHPLDCRRLFREASGGPKRSR